MSRTRTFLFALSACTLLCGSGCKQEMDIYADAREIAIVYAVLNPAQDTQWIRVTRAWQAEGDAIRYGAENDMSMKGLTVSLTGENRSWPGVEMPGIVKQPGTFYPTHSVYAIPTAGLDSLRGGSAYTLHLLRADQADFVCEATTWVPAEPRLSQPGGLIQVSSGRYGLPMVNASEGFMLSFRKPAHAYGYEFRCYVDFESPAGPVHLRYGPGAMVYNFEGCGASSYGCKYYQRDEIVNWLRGEIHEAGGVSSFQYLPLYSYDADSLPDNVRLEVTAVDTVLYRYWVANNPFGFGDLLLQDKPEYSNVRGSGTGVFGSIHTAANRVRLNDCALYETGLVYFPQPPPDCR